jgi:hypothetical protein
MFELLSQYPEVKDLCVAEVSDYLQKHDWQPIVHPNQRLLVFEKGVDDRGEPIQVVLPSRDDYEDGPYLLSKVVNLLAFLDGRSFPETLSAIASSAKHPV